jgi:hypothetical protein
MHDQGVRDRNRAEQGDQEVAPKISVLDQKSSIKALACNLWAQANLTMFY